MRMIKMELPIEEFEKQFENILKTGTTIQLLDQKEPLKYYLNNIKRSPLESIPEFSKRRMRYQTLFNTLNARIEEKKREDRKNYEENLRKSIKQKLPKYINPHPALRYCYGTDANMLRQGLSNPQQVKWHPVTDEKWKISIDGRELQIDLNRVPPEKMEMLMSEPINFIIVKVEDIVALRKGMPTLGLWDHKTKFEDAKNDKPVYSPTYIALRCV
jgi:hypothetical protein